MEYSHVYIIQIQTACFVWNFGDGRWRNITTSNHYLFKYDMLVYESFVSVICSEIYYKKHILYPFVINLTTVMSCFCITLKES